MTPPPDPRPLYVRRATADDLDLVVGLLHNAYDWLIARGITDQWPGPFPPQAIQELIRRGEVHVASTDNVVIATFTLSYQPDPELWDDPPDNAGYIRRLAVHRDYAGHDVGGRLLDYAGRLVAASGRPWFSPWTARNTTPACTTTTARTASSTWARLTYRTANQVLCFNAQRRPPTPARMRDQEHRGPMSRLRLAYERRRPRQAPVLKRARRLPAGVKVAFVAGALAAVASRSLWPVAAACFLVWLDRQRRRKGIARAAVVATCVLAAACVYVLLSDRGQAPLAPSVVELATRDARFAVAVSRDVDLRNLRLNARPVITVAPRPNHGPWRGSVQVHIIAHDAGVRRGSLVFILPPDTEPYAADRLTGQRLKGAQTLRVERSDDFTLVRVPFRDTARDNDLDGTCRRMCERSFLLGFKCATPIAQPAGHARVRFQLRLANRLRQPPAKGLLFLSDIKIAFDREELRRHAILSGQGRPLAGELA